MKKTVIAILVLVAFAGAWLEPRVFVNNRHAHLVYDGHVSQKVKVFHGRDKNTLVWIQDEKRPYEFIGPSELMCSEDTFVNLKVIAVNRKKHDCKLIRLDVRRGEFSIDFNDKDGVPVTVSWEAAPR